MATRYNYPIDLHEASEGGYSVTFPDLDEAFTDGDSFAEAISEAVDCLEEALAGRIVRRDAIPVPSPAMGRPTAVPGATLAAKIALYEALRQEGLSIRAFAVSTGVPENEHTSCWTPPTPRVSADWRKRWPDSANDGGHPRVRMDGE